ncbi:GntR family transcriptional regulator [Psychrobacter lutiphocae]|uniref:GntR family transcriptional regulator n=1 Tax=Psychrobacter lutiphocae TaxID=540500 RepID=UPI00036745B4|nr:GntR family transcriptional regulator [Psychrobacter lutiphocae]
MLEKIEKPKSLKETTLEHLRMAIMIGKLAPGERLVERTLGEQLGVSRTVIRECIRHLESEHLVTLTTAGPQVAVLEEDEIRQIYQLRAMLECEAVRQCAEQVTPAIIAQLQDELRQIRKQLAAGDVAQAMQKARLFYQLLFFNAGMTVAWELSDKLNGRIGRLRFMTLSTPERAEKGPDNLQQIIDKIAKGDAKAAVKACQKHINQACKMSLQINRSGADSNESV